MRRFAALILVFVMLSGCAPTYPKERVKESIIQLCKKEYGLDVKVVTKGKTIAIYLPMHDLIDFNFSVTPSAWDKLNNVILSATRVALSTDAKYDFYCIITNDIRIPEIQIIIIKYIDDAKRVWLGDISRGEFGKRIVFDRRLSPQSQKERSIKDVLSKMAVDKKQQDEIMNDFFRSEPTALSDIGYWNGHFYVKDITMPEFLAEQIAIRTTFAFKDDKYLSENLTLKSSKGALITRKGQRVIKLDVLAEKRVFGLEEDKEVSRKIFSAVFGVAAQVLRSYDFKDFDLVEATDQANNMTIRMTKEELEAFRKNKVKIEEFTE